MPASKPLAKIDALVIGTSAGGMRILEKILPQLSTTLPFAIFLVQHQKATGKHYLCSILDSLCPLPVVEAEDKMCIKAGQLYVAPANYHLLIESAEHIALSMDEPVHCCRPSVDMLFESAAEVFESRLLGIVLTGMGHDGAEGLGQIYQSGGLCAIQNPDTAEYGAMPTAARLKVPNAEIVQLESFGEWLLSLVSTNMHAS